MELNQENIGSRLAAAWSSGRLGEAAGILIDEVKPRCVKSLLFKFGDKLSYEDCEDCFECGVEKLIEHAKTPEEIPNPYAYVWTCATNEAMDMMKERSQVVHFDPEWLGSGQDDISDDGVETQVQGQRRLDHALVITEIALDAEISDSASHRVVKEVLRVAVSRLAPQRQRLIGVLLEHGAFIANELLGELMNRSNGAVRSSKSRAFEELRQLVPQVAEELGVDVTDFLAPEPEVLSDMPASLPSPDEDDLIPPQT